jgi:uncharacterized protein YaeQ
VAITATIYKFDVDLSDTDRQVYESLSILAARHPSESEEYLVTRLLAYCLEFGEGIAFSPGGLSNPDEPALVIRDLTGGIRSWVDIGAPDAARLHRASKSGARVAVYTHKDVSQWLERLSGERIHRAAAVELYAIDRGFVDAVAARLERRMAFSLSIAERELYLSIGEETLSGAVTRHALSHSNV